MNDIDTALMQQVFNVSQSWRNSEIEHDRQADHLWDGL